MPPQVLEGAALPPDVRDLPKPPARLFLHGSVPRGPRVAIVGTREPTTEALAYGEELARQLAERGVAILSGGAKGIDAGAHRGALRASGVTLVVAASGFERPYPADHRALFDEIITSGGGYLSRFQPRVEPRRHQFLDRNALLVALCHALVLVEAPLQSGARNAVAWARRLGRPCFVVPSPPWNERGRGCIAELQLGARALAGVEELLCWLAEHVRELPPGPHRVEAESGSATAVAPPAALISPAAHPVDRENATRAAVLRALEGGARYPEQLADTITTASLAELNHAVLTLLLSGLIARSADGELTATRR